MAVAVALASLVGCGQGEEPMRQEPSSPSSPKSSSSKPSSSSSSSSKSSAPVPVRPALAPLVGAWAGTARHSLGNATVTASVRADGSVSYLVQSGGVSRAGTGRIEDFDGASLTVSGQLPGQPGKRHRLTGRVTLADDRMDLEVPVVGVVTMWRFED